MKQTKITLEENEIPERWYNIVADMPNKPLPPLNPATQEPIGPEALAPLFPMALIEQEVSADRWIPIPEQVRQIYTQWRPTPMYRAYGLEKALDTPAHIYYKYEGVSPAGSHKPNTAVAQAFYNKKKASSGSRPKPALVSGAARSATRASSLESAARCSWCASATTRSRIGS